MQGEWHVDNAQTATAKRFSISLTNMLTYEHLQPRRRQAYPHAPNAVLSENPARLVVAVAAVLGSETAEVLVTQKFITRGTRASRPAKHGRSPRDPSASS